MTKKMQDNAPDSATVEQNEAQEVAQALTRAEAERIARDAAQKAREEEKRKLYGEIEREKNQRTTLEAELARREKAEKEAKLASLPVDQQIQAKLAELEESVARERGARLELEKAANHRIRQLGLVAYRERALRDVPTEVHEFVQGEDEESIDRAVDMAKTTYSSLEQRIRQNLESQFSRAAAMAPPSVGVPAPPPNPAYVAPPSPHAQGGFPTAANPIPVSMEPAPFDTGELTTEQAVRSGRYGGEMREQIHARLKGQMRYPGSIGSAPRHWSTAQPSAMQAVEMPGGVVQPQGFATGPVTPPGMAQPMTQMAPQGNIGAREAAAAAVQRTHQGLNPVADPGTRQAVADSQAFAQQRGIPDAASAFAQRFSPTPPVTG